MSKSYLNMIVIFLYQSESQPYLIKKVGIPTDENNRVMLSSQIVALNKNLILDPKIKLSLINILYDLGQKEIALAELKNLEKSDPENPDILNAIAYVYFGLGDRQNYMNYLNKITHIDPWNAAIYLELGVLAKQDKDYINMNLMKDKILSFAENNLISKIAADSLTVTP